MQIYEIEKEDFLPINQEVEKTFSIGLLTGEKFVDAQWLCMEISVSGGDDSNICLWWSENSSSEPQFYMLHRIIPNCLATIAFPISEKNFSLHSAFIPPFGALRKGDTNGKPMKKAEKILNDGINMPKSYGEAKTFFNQEAHIHYYLGLVTGRKEYFEEASVYKAAISEISLFRALALRKLSKFTEAKSAKFGDVGPSTGMTKLHC